MAPRAKLSVDKLYVNVSRSLSTFRIQTTAPQNMQDGEQESKRGFMGQAFDYFYKTEPLWPTLGAGVASFLAERWMANPKWLPSVAVAMGAVYFCAALPMWIDAYFDMVPTGGYLSKCSVVAVVLNLVARFLLMRAIGTQFGPRPEAQGALANQSLKSSLAVLAGANIAAWIGYAGSFA